MNIRRRFCFDKAKNIRDLGGFPTTDGKITEFGVLIRSEELYELSISEKEQLYQYGVRSVFDFRNESECYIKPHSLKDYKDIRYKNIPLFTDTHKTVIRLDIDWKNAYVDIIETYKHWVKEALGSILQSEGTVLFNCTTGKDRTGLISAILLEIVHTYRDDIYADYSVSQMYLKQKYYSMIKELNYHEAPESIICAPFFSTNPQNIHYLLEYLDSTYGSATDYLASLGINDGIINSFKSRFLSNGIAG